MLIRSVNNRAIVFTTFAVLVGISALTLGSCASSSKSLRPRSWRADSVLRSEVRPLLNALEQGDFVQIETALSSNKAPADNPYFSVAQSLVQLVKTIQSVESQIDETFRNEKTWSDSFFTKAYALVAEADAGLATSDMLLEKAQGYRSLKWVSTPGSWAIDWNKNGKISTRERDRLKFLFDESGRFLPKSDPRRAPTVAFDQSDVYWLRSYIAFARSALMFFQSYDWSILGRLMNGDHGMASLAALQIRVPIRDRTLANALGQHLRGGITLAQQSRQLIAAETDSDREWVPSPTQTGATPHTMTAEIFAQWGKSLGDVDDLFAGKTGISLREAIGGVREVRNFAVDGFLDIHALLDKPAAIELATADLLAFAMSPPNTRQAILKKILKTGYSEKMTVSPITRDVNSLLPNARQDIGMVRRLGSLFFWLN